MALLATKRLAKELKEITVCGTPDGIDLLQAESMDRWVFTVRVLGDETVYKGETFAILFKFPPRYPIEPPQVTFLVEDKWQAPLHPHIYSNGHICASVLDNDWTPVLTAVSVCITMQSMLASNKTKQRPKGNDEYVRRAPKNPQDTRWVYHDDAASLVGQELRIGQISS